MEAIGYSAESILDDTPLSSSSIDLKDLITMCDIDNPDNLLPYSVQTVNISQSIPDANHHQIAGYSDFLSPSTVIDSTVYQPINAIPETQEYHSYGLNHGKDTLYSDYNSIPESFSYMNLGSQYQSEFSSNGYTSRDIGQNGSYGIQSSPYSTSTNTYSSQNFSTPGSNVVPQGYSPSSLSTGPGLYPSEYEQVDTLVGTSQLPYSDSMPCDTLYQYQYGPDSHNSLSSMGGSNTFGDSNLSVTHGPCPLPNLFDNRYGDQETESIRMLDTHLNTTSPLSLSSLSPIISPDTSMGPWESNISGNVHSVRYISSSSAVSSPETNSMCNSKKCISKYCTVHRHKSVSHSNLTADEIKKRSTGLNNEACKRYRLRKKMEKTQSGQTERLQQERRD